MHTMLTRFQKRKRDQAENYRKSLPDYALWTKRMEKLSNEDKTLLDAIGKGYEIKFGPGSSDPGYGYCNKLHMFELQFERAKTDNKTPEEIIADAVRTKQMMPTYDAEKKAFWSQYD